MFFVTHHSQQRNRHSTFGCCRSLPVRVGRFCCSRIGRPQRRPARQVSLTAGSGLGGCACSRIGSAASRPARQVSLTAVRVGAVLVPESARLRRWPAEASPRSLPVGLGRFCVLEDRLGCGTGLLRQVHAHRRFGLGRFCLLEDRLRCGTGLFRQVRAHCRFGLAAGLRARGSARPRRWPAEANPRSTAASGCGSSACSRIGPASGLAC
jgi:hypothetical protein